MTELTVTQAADRLKVSRRTIHNWIAKGYFPNAYKLDPHTANSHYRIPETDIQALEQQRRSPQ
jgi:excisionase family DNA binding protein